MGVGVASKLKSCKEINKIIIEPIIVSGLD